MKEGSKQFFFEKKHQKTFVLGAVLFITPAATVEVAVQDVRNDHGHVLVALCSRAEFLHPHCAWQGSAPAHPGTVAIRVDRVPPGTYAVQAFHDENDNGRIDRSFFGLPEEGMGFSNDARMYLGPPRFDAAAFAVTDAGASVHLHLRYRF